MSRRLTALMCLVSAIAMAAIVPMLGFTAQPASPEPPLAAPLPPTTPPTRMLVGAWNYTPDASVSQVKGIVRAGFRYQHPPGEWDWSAVYVALTVDGRDCTDAQAVARLKDLPVLDIVNAFEWQTFHARPPPAFDRAGIERVNDLIASLRLRLKAAGLSEHKLDRLNIVLDAENPGPFTLSKFADPEGKHKDQPAQANVPHLATVCHLMTQAFAACKWEQRDGALMMNYNTSHAARAPPDLGRAPFWRASPYWVPGSCSEGHFHSAYWVGGPAGCLDKDEVLDVIARGKAPLWLALEDNQPGLLEILKTARASGKVNLVLLWGNGKGTPQTGDTGNRHREVEKGGSRAWIRKQDSEIWSVVK